MAHVPADVAPATAGAFRLIARNNTWTTAKSLVLLAFAWLDDHDPGGTTLRQEITDLTGLAPPTVFEEAEALVDLGVLDRAGETENDYRLAQP